MKKKSKSSSRPSSRLSRRKPRRKQVSQKLARQLFEAGGGVLGGPDAVIPSVGILVEHKASPSRYSRPAKF